MPSVSGKQKKFMQAVANNPEFAKKAGVPQSVGKDFAEADKVKTPKSRSDLQGINKPKTDHGSMNLFKEGGAMKSDMKQDKAMVKKAVGMHDKQMHGGKSTDMDKLKKGGMPMVMKDGKKMPAFAAKKAGMGRGMTADKAGRAMSAPTPDMMGRAMAKRPMAAAPPAPAAPMMKKGGMTKMAKGGGIESKGKTKGKMISMNRGGRAC
jgi:hypothetical protein